MIINLLNRLSLSLKVNYSSYIYNSILVSVEINLILFNIKKRLIFNNYFFINILNIKHILRV